MPPYEIEKHGKVHAILNSMFCFILFYFILFYFIKEIENISPRVPIRYRNTRESLGELEIAWKHTRPADSCSHFNFSFSQTSTRVSTSISRSPKLPLVFPLQFLVLSNFHSCFHFNFSFSQTFTRVSTSISRSLKLPLVFPLQFLVLSNLHSCLYNCMETRKMFSIS